MKTVLRSVLVALAIAASGCGDGGAGPPQPGPLQLSLTTPASDDGAIMFTITGPGVTSAAATSPAHRVFSRVVSADELRVIVLGNLAAGPLLTVQVGDVARPASYTAAIVEVAARDDAVRTSLAGYDVTLSR